MHILFRNESSVGEHQHYIHLELDFEGSGARDGGAREQTRKDHVDRDFNTTRDVSIYKLDILNFSGYRSGQRGRLEQYLLWRIHQNNRTSQL